MKLLKLHYDFLHQNDITSSHGTQPRTCSFAHIIYAMPVSVTCLK